jgi:hypothetical protein
VSASYKPDQRWRLLVPAGAVVMTVGRRRTTFRQVRDLPSGTTVALVGGRRLRGLARVAGLRIRAEYVALPSLAMPVAISTVAREPLRWTARTVLTVPSGVTRLHAPLWLAVRLVRALPAVLPRLPAGDRILIGTRS